jgi:hypothetical protein
MGREAALTLDGYNVALTSSAAIAAKIDPARAKPLVDSVRMGQGKIDMVGKLTPFALQEFGADEHCSPTAALFAIFGMAYLAGARARQLFAAEAAETKPTEAHDPTRPPG